MTPTPRRALRPSRLRAVKLAVATAAVGVCVAAGAAPALAAAKVLASDNDFRVKPASILWTGDGTGRLHHITWTRYGGRKAVGRGTDRTITCDPSCAEGRAVNRPARVFVSRKRRGRYTRMKIIERGGSVFRRKVYNASGSRTDPNWVWIGF